MEKLTRSPSDFVRVSTKRLSRCNCGFPFYKEAFIYTHIYKRERKEKTVSRKKLCREREITIVAEAR